ncbi:MAG TPA: tetratricopeptide repeat protein [Bacteroidia bacterium]|nr:tetratricopeptide repeat protein [Bacteroidia bacterium]HNT79061.1 tetratricopeptide repeat protein [Bacteroidia bacterium]
MNKKYLKLLAVIVAIALIPLIYFLPKQKVSEKEQVTNVNDFASNDFESQLLSKAELKAPPILTKELNQIKDSIKSSGCDQYVALANKWLEYQRYGIAAMYFEKCSNNGRDTLISLAAENYLEALRFSQDSLEMRHYGSKAIQSFQKYLDSDTSNLDIKTSLAVAMVESGQNPMQGIMLLREVLATDPDNANALINMGFFSIRSGQYEKAIERFEHLLKTDPSRIEVYLYLGESYQQIGNKNEAIRQFNLFLQYSDDEDLKTEVKSYINQIKNNL